MGDLRFGCYVNRCHSCACLATNTEDDHRYILEHSGAVCALCQVVWWDRALFWQLTNYRRSKNVISFETDLLSQTKAKTALHAFETLLSEHEPCRDLPSHIDKLKADDTCCFIYTSGTGGRPKGVMLTHRSIQSNIDAAAELLDEGDAKEDAVFLSLLPLLSHSYEHTAGMHLPFQMGKPSLVLRER